MDRQYPGEPFLIPVSVMQLAEFFLIWLFVQLEGCMIVGIDTYHDSSQKGRSVGGFVASLNKRYTRLVQRAVIFPSCCTLPPSTVALDRENHSSCLVPVSAPS